MSLDRHEFPVPDWVEEDACRTVGRLLDDATLRFELDALQARVLHDPDGFARSISARRWRLLVNGASLDEVAYRMAVLGRLRDALLFLAELDAVPTVGRRRRRRRHRPA